MKLIVSDETLRDGEQQVGVNFSMHDKLRIARKINECGIDQIAIMPAVSKYEEILVKELLTTSFKEKIFASTMLDNKYVDHSHNLGIRNLILFTSLSDILLNVKGISKENNILKAMAVCHYAKNKQMKIFFAGEDSTRAELKYVIRFIKAIEKYIEGFILCDTVGVLTPSDTKTLMQKILSKTKCKIGVHFHNDRGMANENSLVAIQNGASMLSATAGGIGERAGNADYCAVLRRLHVKKENAGIKNEDLPDLRELVYKLGGSKPAEPYSDRAFWHESGIHVNALIRNPLSYNSFLPKTLHRKDVFFFGKYSGMSNYKYIFGKKYNEQQLVRIRDWIKELSYKNLTSYTEQEVKKLTKRMDFLH